MGRLGLGTWGLLVLLGSTSWAQVTQRVSLDSNGAQANDSSGLPSISGDGRYVAFFSWATNLAPGNTNGQLEVFFRDRLLGTTELVSISSGGTPGNDQCVDPSISADGRYVAFSSYATNLVPGDTNGTGDVFVRDRLSGTTDRVSISSSGAQGDFSSWSPSISGDGRYVAFMSDSYNLVPGDSWNGLPDALVHDRLSGTTECVSNVATGGQARDDLWWLEAKISADGNVVAFTSYAKNLVPGVTNGLPHVFVRDRVSGSIECPSVTLSGHVGGRSNWSPSLSADGRYVAFASSEDNLVPGDTNATTDIFVCLRAGFTYMPERVSVDSHGVQGNDVSYIPMISADGRYVTFESEATNLVQGDTNQSPDVFVHDRLTRTTERVNLEPSGGQGHFGGYGLSPSISADGRFVAFHSFANDLIAGDTNHFTDVFVRDRMHGPYASLCDPGVSGVAQCPCSNPPSGPKRGCDNSSGTGGASLSISGGEYLSSDSIVFTTSGEIPNALSIVLQGTISIPAGTIYGQGVRCIGGSLKRMYVMTSLDGGRMTVPNILAGEPTVHARSAALGDTILAGSTRWYMVLYRDPIVLGHCPASGSFNTTQTRAISWLP